MIFGVRPGVWPEEHENAASAEPFASELACYAKQLGATHISLAYDCYERNELCAFINIMHEGALGVILELPQEASSLVDAVAQVLGECHCDGIYVRGESPRPELSVLKKEMPWLLVLTDTDAAEAELCRDGSFSEYISAFLSAHCRTFGDLGQLFADTERKSAHCARLLAPGDHARQALGSFSDTDKREERLSALRSLLALWLTSPGAKYAPMGSEPGVFDAAMPRDDLPEKAQASLQLCFARLAHLYQSLPALYQNDDGTYQAPAFDRGHGVLCFARGRGTAAPVSVVVNLSGNSYYGYSLSVPAPGTYRVLFSSDDRELGGEGRVPSRPLISETERDGRYILRVTVPPLAAAVFLRVDTGRDTRDTLS